MKQFAQTLVSWGPVGLFVVAILDSAGVPIVGGVDALLVLLAAAQPGRAYLLASLAVAGSTIGTFFLYFLARRGGQAYLERRTASGRGARMRQWYRRYGLLTVFVPAVCPVPPMPMKLFILSAGAMGVTPVAFGAVLVAARVIRYFGLAYLGRQLGEHSWAYLRTHAWHILVLAGLLGVVVVVLARMVEKRRRMKLT